MIFEILTTITMLASAYDAGIDSGGPLKCSGQTLQPYDMIVASNSLPCRTPLRVCYGTKWITKRFHTGVTKSNGKKVIRYFQKKIKVNNCVFAKVMDTGGFSDLGVDIDLGPGVWKSFGYSMNEWGHRPVEVQILKGK